jgi:hypothetical protein
MESKLEKKGQKIEWGKNTENNKNFHNSIHTYMYAYIHILGWI